MTQEQADTGLQGTETTEEALQESSNPEQTTGSGTVAVEETFFDPKSIEHSPELQAAYKQMQSAWTKKMQSLSGSNDKVKAYDAFMQDPVKQAQQILGQYGYNVVQNDQQSQQQDFNPQNWNDVMQEATKIAEQNIMEKLSPVLNEFKQTKRTSIEQQLDGLDPQWRTYEDSMTKLVSAHPTLANDPETLYRMSVPQDVIESRARQAAMRKLESQRQSAQSSGGGTTNRKPSNTNRATSFNEAVTIAKQQLAEKGIRLN